MSLTKQPVDYVILKDVTITKKHPVIKFITTTLIVIVSLIGFLVFSYAASCCAGKSYENIYQPR